MAKLTEKQVKASVLLAAGRTGRETAKEVGVTPETISVWRRGPEFEAEINRLKLEALHAARDRMRNLAAEAVSEVEDLIKNAKTDAVRLKAAQAVLDTVGLTNPTSGLWAWGIGKTTPEGVMREREDKANPRAAALRSILEGF